MKSVVTNRQIFLILLLTITGYSAISLPKDAVQSVGTGAWFTMLLLTIVFTIAMFFIASLNKLFLGKTIFEYSSIVAGRLFGLIINIFYTVYFSIVAVSLTRGIAEFLNECYLPQTPIWVLLLLIIVPCLYIGYKGITNVGRICEIFGILFIFVTISIFSAGIFLGDIEYAKPFFEISKLKTYVFGMSDLLFAFLGLEILTIIPFGKNNSKKGVIISMTGVFFTGLLYIYAVYSSILTIGISDILNYSNSLVEGLREIHLPSTFLLERVDILYLTTGVSGIICGLGTLFFVVSEFFSKFFIKVKRYNLFLITGLILFIFCNFIVSYDIALLIFKYVLPVLGIFTAIIIPITLFCLAKRRNLTNE